MKRFTLLSAIMIAIFILFISMPVMAGSAHDNNSVGWGNNNTQISGNHNSVGGNHGTNAGGGNITATGGSARAYGGTGIGIGGQGGKGGNATIEKGAVQVKNTNVNLNANINKNKNINKNTNVNLNCNKNVNVNKNKNVNINKNTNKQAQGQIQGQMQGQMQGQTAHNEGVEQDVVFNQTIEAAETKRDHHTGTPVTFASLGSYAESRFAGAAFQTAKMLTMFKDTFSYEGASEVYGKAFGKGLCITTGKSFNGRHEDDPSKEIKVYTLDDKIIPGSIKAIGFLTIKGTPGEDATSFIVLQKAILSACIMQGDAIVITKEGAETITKSSGWGIGFNTSGSMINDQANRGKSAAASGGTGYSSGKGQLEIIPWMTVQVLKFK